MSPPSTELSSLSCTVGSHYLFCTHSVDRSILISLCVPPSTFPAGSTVHSLYPYLCSSPWKYVHVYINAYFCWPVSLAKDSYPFYLSIPFLCFFFFFNTSILCEQLSLPTPASLCFLSLGSYWSPYQHLLLLVIKWSFWSPLLSPGIDIFFSILYKTPSENFPSFSYPEEFWT